MSTNETIETLKANLARLRDEAKTDPSKREDVKKAWAALDAASPKQKVSSFACRAGQRQYAERLAQHRRSR